MAALVAPPAATAARIRVHPGESIQAAVDAAAPGDTVRVMPGDYMEPHNDVAAIRITKRLKLLASTSSGAKVRILPRPGSAQRHGILVEPESATGPVVEHVKIKGFTVEGFLKNGIWLRHVANYRIERNTSIDNLENGIWPTLSANGLVKNNVSYGSLDSALWVEASENVRVMRNELANAPTGLEITVSKRIVAKYNDIHDNTVGVGLYHPSQAGLSPLGGDGHWTIDNNHIHDNNFPNAAPVGSSSALLPPGIGVLMLGIDHATITRNVIERNDLFGLVLVDYCLVVAGTRFDCSLNPPEVEASADFNVVTDNRFIDNWLHPSGDFAALASDIGTLGGTHNCYSGNTLAKSVPDMLPPCP